MGYIIYPTWSPRQEASGAPSGKVTGYRKHLFNEMILGHIAVHARNYDRRVQAENEAAVARRKRLWHEGKLNCDLSMVTAIVRRDFAQWVANQPPSRPRSKLRPTLGKR